MKTYEEVGRKAGLNERDRKRYVSYMTQRWPETEEQKSSDGYAMQWANRFKDGMEWAYSDICGRDVLKKIDGNWNEKRQRP